MATIETSQRELGPMKCLRTILLIGIAITTCKAQVYTILHQFNGANGQTPLAHLILDSNGALYGTTLDGGSSSQGTVFKLIGSKIEFYSFAGGSDGSNPMRELVRDTAGNVYGTTTAGGSFGSGTVFKIDATGKKTVIYNFSGGDGVQFLVDGGQPQCGLVRDSAGNLYGTTVLGGTAGWGTVFKIDPNGNETILHSFTGAGDGGFPFAGLHQDSSGILYGTIGGDSATTWGTVFKMDTSGNETVLHVFTGGNDGGLPMAALVLDAAGNIYGTTYYGGSSGKGVVFKLDPTGNETVLHTFGGHDGANPVSRLAQDSAGNFYGTTELGGQYNSGTLFKLDPQNNETVLHSFAGSKGADGAYPDAGPILDPSGSLYGTTAFGGTGSGIVFKFTP